MFRSLPAKLLLHKPNAHIEREREKSPWKGRDQQRFVTKKNQNEVMGHMLKTLDETIGIHLK